MRSRIMFIGCFVCVLCLIGCMALVGSYYKGRHDESVKCNLAQSTELLQRVGKKEEIRVEIAKKTVPEKRKALSRYVIKEN